MRMKKFINDPKNLVPELLDGFTLAFPDKIRLSGTNTVVRATPNARVVNRRPSNRTLLDHALCKHYLGLDRKASSYEARR